MRPRISRHFCNNYEILITIKILSINLKYISATRRMRVMNVKNETNLSETFLKPGSILEGPFWPERIKIISYKEIGTGVEVQGIGLKSERFYSHSAEK